jgi:hypothetical protein
MLTTVTACLIISYLMVLVPKLSPTHLLPPKVSSCSFYPPFFLPAVLRILTTRFLAFLKRARAGF